MDNKFGKKSGANADSLRDTASAKLQELMKDAESLISRVAEIKDPQIANVRSKVEEAINGARGTH